MFAYFPCLYTIALIDRQIDTILSLLEVTFLTARVNVYTDQDTLGIGLS